jgi:hypothetical protein
VPAAPLRPHGGIVQSAKNRSRTRDQDHSQTCDAGTWEQDSIPQTFSVAEVLQTIGAASFMRGAIMPNASYRVAATWPMSIAGSRHCASQPKCEVTIHGDQSK